MTDSDVRRWRVPGRVNLVGEHLDYNGGPSVPFAIDRFVSIKVRRRDDDAVNVWSTLPGGGTERAAFTTAVAPGEVTGWAGYLAGTVWSLREAEHPVPGADLVLESDLPSGAGLSSSAALTVGTATALADLAGADLDPTTLALLAQRAENDYVGAPTGVMDQLAVAHGRRAHAVRTDPSTTPPGVDVVPFAVADDGLVVLVVDTGVHHAHADGGYADRRRESEAAAAQLGLEHLAAAGPDAILRLEDETLKARTRHVITETARVRAALRALADRAWPQLGTILTASHESLRDDYAVSCAELDVAVEAALEAGALGARMTGGGFGGSAIALVPQDRVDAVTGLVRERFEALGWSRPAVFPVLPADGPTRIV
ncbi:MAG: galactokinase [Aeromicrobium erythreum]